MEEKEINPLVQEMRKSAGSATAHSHGEEHVNGKSNEPINPRGQGNKKFPLTLVALVIIILGGLVFAVMYYQQQNPDSNLLENIPFLGGEEELVVPTLIEVTPTVTIEITPS